MPRLRGRGRVRKHPSVQQTVPNIGGRFFGGRNLNRDERMEPSKQLLQLPDQPEQKAGGERAENGEREPAIHQRLFDRHRAVIIAHLSIEHQKDIDLEKRNDELKQLLEKSKEIERTFIPPKDSAEKSSS